MKSLIPEFAINPRASLPSWERGLKSGSVPLLNSPIWSLPSWERGLKLKRWLHRKKFVLVAPLVGAWIEIYSTALKLLMNIVAPLVGAWIEISMSAMGASLSKVAPLVGAWIEI